ncbi:YcnI family copper-binding membrane protein [Nocardia camponoti]|uniref:YncI copper-binding domain-containing protein n=1 Tax=Nocardia camponoti TaxID=1616106 RepID=A0A917QKT7_9NOCA|nr:YcnI family protein [Nocardia camponoti]GGK55104.1 hypothetical protein GCM10011591_28800 [Nocardia camponoti]
MHNRIMRGAGATVVAFGLTAIGAGIASAHVTVDAPGAAQGKYTVATFKVPTESDTASTTALKLTIPNLKVRTEPMPGWTSNVEKNAKGEATSVTWTAAPGNTGVGPGQFQRFVLSIGPLPKQDSVTFPAQQTYSDGKVVAWDQSSSGGAEPEHPAPALTLTAGGSTDNHDQAAPAAENDSSDKVARWLGGAGLALGLFATALGLGVVIRKRQS